MRRAAREKRFRPVRLRLTGDGAASYATGSGEWISVSGFPVPSSFAQEPKLYRVARRAANANHVGRGRDGNALRPLAAADAAMARSLAAEEAKLAAATGPASVSGLADGLEPESGASKRPSRAASRRCRTLASFRRRAAVPGAHFRRIRAARARILPRLGIAALAAAIEIVPLAKREKWKRRLWKNARVEALARTPFIIPSKCTKNQYHVK
jgi:hypothetical protein